MATHEVANQPPPLADWNLFATDRALVDALRREGGAWAEAELGTMGARLGSAEVVDWGARARRLVERLALALQGALLVRHAPEAVVEVFCVSRLDGERGHGFGALPPSLSKSAVGQVLERAWP